MPQARSELTCVIDQSEPVKPESIVPQSTPPSVVGPPPVADFGRRNNSVQTCPIHTEPGRFRCGFGCNVTPNPLIFVPCVVGSQRDNCCWSFCPVDAYRRKKRNGGESAPGVLLGRKPRSQRLWIQKIKADGTESDSEGSGGRDGTGTVEAWYDGRIAWSSTWTGNCRCRNRDAVSSSQSQRAPRRDPARQHPQDGRPTIHVSS